MFYERFLQVCHEKGVKPTTVIRNAGVGSASAYKLHGNTPKSVTLCKIAQTLNVGIEDLIPVSEMQGETKTLYMALHGDNSIASKLQLLRCYREWSYNTLGEIMQVTGLTARRFASNEAFPTVYSVDLLAKWIDVKLGVLLSPDVHYDPAGSYPQYSAADVKNIGRSVRHLRALQGMSMARYAKTLGIQEELLCRIESDPIYVKYDELLNFAGAADITVSSLCCGVEATAKHSGSFAALTPGRRVRYFRIISGRTLDWVSEASGISKTRLSKIESDGFSKGLKHDDVQVLSRVFKQPQLLFSMAISDDSFRLHSA